MLLGGVTSMFMKLRPINYRSRSISRVHTKVSIAPVFAADMPLSWLYASPRCVSKRSANWASDSLKVFTKQAANVAKASRP